MDERKERSELAQRVILSCTAELSQRYPALEGALACLQLMERPEPFFETDGNVFYYSPDKVIELFASSPSALRRGYLHVLLHCLFLHILPPEGADSTLWDLACDILVENAIEELHDARFGVSSEKKRQVLSLLKNDMLLPSALTRRLTELPFTVDEMRGLFAFDSHSLWSPRMAEGIKEKWEKARAFSGEKSNSEGSQGTGSGNEEETAEEEQQRPFDYRRFLRRFTVPREEIETDEESFDYIYYTLGLDIYGSIPLIEPLEYKEVRRIDELVIAIDTSASCSRDLVSRFLNETWSILSAEENFFHKMKVVVFQCDFLIQDTAIIRSAEDWQRYTANLKIRGRGGTDFRPVFKEIEKWRTEGKLKRPRALLYFTDGEGIYPQTAPDYGTAFVLAGETVHPDRVPQWAKCLELKGEQ